MSKPDVTSPEWVDWALEEMRRERAAAAEAADRPPDSVPEAPASVDEAPEPAEVRRRRPAAGLVLAAVALVAVLAGGWWWTRQPDDDHDQARSVAARTRVAPAAPAAPVTLPANGAHTVITVLPSGDLAVKRWVRGSGETRYQQFRLSGALDRSGGNRALARVPPVPRDGSPPGPQTIDVVGGTILALACTPGSGAGTAVPVPCGADAGATGWRVVRPAGWGAVHVTAQLDLDQG